MVTIAMVALLSIAHCEGYLFSQAMNRPEGSSVVRQDRGEATISMDGAFIQLRCVDEVYEAQIMEIRI